MFFERGHYMIKIQACILNVNGKRLIFDEIREHSLCYITVNEGKFGGLNSDGIEIIETKWDKVIPTEYGFYIVEDNNKFGLFDQTGTERLPAIYTEISPNVNEDMIEICIDKKIGFYNIEEKYIIEPKYDYASKFTKGLAKVKINKLYGYIDKKGNQVIKIKYEWISDFYSDVVKVHIDDKYGYVTRDGFEILEPEYNEVGSDGDRYNFYFGRKETKFTCVDRTGKKIFILDAITGIEEVGEGYKKVPVDIYEENYEFDSGISVVKSRGRYTCTRDAVIIATFYEF